MRVCWWPRTTTWYSLVIRCSQVHLLLLPLSSALGQAMEDSGGKSREWAFHTETGRLNRSVPSTLMGLQELLQNKMEKSVQIKRGNTCIFTWKVTYKRLQYKHESNGISSSERTVIDFFRARHIWGSDLATAILKRWLSKHGNSPANPLTMAKQFPDAYPSLLPLWRFFFYELGSPRMVRASYHHATFLWGS